jgi:hypothetical protein
MRRRSVKLRRPVQPTTSRMFWRIFSLESILEMKVVRVDKKEGENWLLVLDSGFARVVETKSRVSRRK